MREAPMSDGICSDGVRADGRGRGRGARSGGCDGGGGGGGSRLRASHLLRRVKVRALTCRRSRRSVRFRRSESCVERCTGRRARGLGSGIVGCFGQEAALEGACSRSAIESQMRALLLLLVHVWIEGQLGVFAQLVEKVEHLVVGRRLGQCECTGHILSTGTRGDNRNWREQGSSSFEKRQC